MRKLWAKVLSGEKSKEPGRTSLRTLDILKNMTQGRMRESIQQTCATFVMEDFIFYPCEEQSGQTSEISTAMMFMLHLEIV